MTNIKIINITLIVLLILIGCNTSKQLSKTQPYVKVWYSVDNKNEIIDISYYRDNNSLAALLVVNFETQQSLYIVKDEQGNTRCKGSFDVASYDSTKWYTTTIAYLDEDGNVDLFADYHFNLMKSGVWNYYYRNSGALQMQGNYVQNERDGIWNFYSSIGELIVIRTYDMGKVVKNEVLTKDWFIMPSD